MKYVDEFRDRELAEGLASAIRREAHPSRRYNIMEFCGGTPTPFSVMACTI